MIENNAPGLLYKTCVVIVASNAYVFLIIKNLFCASRRFAITLGLVRNSCLDGSNSCS